MPERQAITTLAGAASALLTVDSTNAGSVAAHSIFLPRDWKRSTPFVIDDIVVQPLNNSNWGQEMIFELPKLAHLVKSMALRIRLPAHTVNPLNTAALADHFGFASIEYFRTLFGANLCYETQDYDLYFDYRQMHGTERRDAVNTLIGGDQTTAQRTTDLANGREYIVPLYQPFEEHQSKSFPLLTLSQKTRFVLKTKAFQNLYTTSNPATTVVPNTQVQFELLLKVVHTTGDEAMIVSHMSRQKKGICYMIHQHVRQNSDFVQNTASNFTANIKLTGITKPMKSMFMGFIPDRLVNNTGFNDIFMFAPNPNPLPAGMNPYNPIQQWGLTGNSLIIQRPISRNYDRIYNHFMYVESPAGDEIFHQYYNEFPNSYSSSIGFFDYTNVNNAAVDFTFGIGGTGVDPINPAQAQILRFIVNGKDYNFWYFCNGNFTRTFN
jgi:hypothetical protein